MYSGIKLIVYDSVVTLNSGASGHGWLVSAAPPVLCRALEHDNLLAVLGQVGGRDETVVASADHDRVVLLFAICSLLLVGDNRGHNTD